MHEHCLLLTYCILTNTFVFTFETTYSIISEDDFLANYNFTFTKMFYLSVMHFTVYFESGAL